MREVPILLGGQWDQAVGRVTLADKAEAVAWDQTALSPVFKGDYRDGYLVGFDLVPYPVEVEIEGVEGAPEVSTGEVKAFDRYQDNSGLIEAAARLGYLHTHRLTLDATWGQGTFWKKFRPKRLVGLDRVLHKIATLSTGVQGDFTELPFRDRAFWATVLDGPYKLNGTPDEKVDARYGVDVPSTWQGRMALIRQGIESAARVTDQFLLVKCQDQVSSGKVRWQTRDFSDWAEDQGFRLRDELFIEGGRPQPEGRRQVHARRNYSTLLVLQRDA